MALDVHLKRVSNSTWEFRVIGKQGFNISVTEAQLPERRRQKVVAAVQEQAYSSTSSTSSDEESQPSQEVTSGLYDPVLDDTEVIYETIEPADSDQPSNQLDQPTEVFEVKQFTDQLDLTRSLTTSPFLVPPKPYRPFSTEPLEIPPLENPIILNPNYKDAFNSKEVEESLPETRFKLPISAQYDPDTKIKKEKTLSDNKITTITNKESIKDCKKEIKIESESTENTNEKVQKAAETINEEYKYLNKLKSEIDLEKIESTALAVVDESIQQAVTVAEEIKKEINSEIKQTDLREITSESNAHEESIHTSVKYQVEEEASKIQFNTKQSNKSEINVKETQQDIRQVTDELVQTTLEQKYDNSADIKAKTQFDTIESEKKSFKTDSKQESSSEKTEIFEAASEKKESGVTISSEKLLAEQRAYTIGLQTIPNIKGTIQSSYQYDLLLKTFFIHLTDVMVALSRFIITDPITTISKSDIEEKKKEINIKETKKNSVDKTIVEQKTQVHLAKKQSINKATDDKAHTENKQSVFETVTRIEADIVTNGENEAIKIQEKNINSSKNFDKEKVEKEFHHLHDSEENLTNEMEKYEIMVDEAELITKTKLSGAKIAQIEGRKSVELTDKMDKVITEFQRKSGTTEILDKEKLVDRKRSRSRSKVQEEILSVTNSSQLDSNKYVNVVESKFDRQHTSSKMGQYKSLENEKVETKDSGKITYVAIVEAHVYTNKQAIFEEQMRRMSEINTATQVEESSKMTSSSSECINYQNNVIKKQSLASSDIHKSARVVAEKVETFVQHQTGVVKVAKVKEQLNKEVVEDAKFVLAETMTTAVEEAKVDALQASKIKKAHARVDIESAVAHETVEVSLEESTHKELIIPDVTIKQSKPILQEGALGVAEVISTTIQEKDQELLVIKAKDEHAKVVINESAATLITEVLPLEPKDETLNIPEINKKQPHKKIHESILKVPETSIITIEECKGEIETAKVKVEKATVQVELSKVAETITTLCEEPEQKPPNVPNISTVQSKIIIEEPVLHTIEVHEVKVHDAKCEITDVSDTSKNIEEDISTQYTVELATDDHEKTYQEESAELKIIKHQIIEVTPPIEIYEDFQFDKKKLEIEQKEFQVVNTHEENIHLSHKATGLTKDNVVASEVQSSQTTYEQSACIKDQSSVHIQAMHSEKYTSENIQTLESNKSAKIKLDTQKSKELSLKSGAEGKLTLHTDVTNKTKANDENCPILTSTSVPPTPLVDEYVFKLEIPLPKSRGSTPIPRDCSVTPPSEHEDPNIVKKKLVPQIDTKIEQVVYDPPLPSPSTSPGTKSPPKYVKPGLRGGSDRPEITKDEIMEIERKSTLLTSAIDRTIRSIEEYKESVGIDMKQEIQVETKNDTSHTIIEESLDNNSEKSVSDGYNENTEKVNGYTEVKEENEYRDHLEGINKSSGSDEIEHHIEETIVLNGKKNGTTIEYRETTNESISNDQEEDNDEIFETVTINLSNSKRNSIEETNCTSVKIESDEEKEKQYEIIKHEYEDSTDVESVQFELVKNKFESQSENNDVSKAEEINVKVEDTPKEIVKKIDPLQGYRPVEFNPETYKQRKNPEILITDQVIWSSRTELYKTESGELIGSQQGIIDGLEEPVVDPEIAKELGKPGMPEEKIAELISGESEMLREAHVMGLTRVLTSHMHRILDDDCSVDFKKIKPLVDSLKDSEVLKALNEEILKNKAEKIKDERKWTTFLQKPVQKQKQKIVLSGNRDDVKSCNLESLYSHMEGDASEPYRVKIVKQPKPRIAPDYKPEDFDTGPLPWEERAVKEEKEAVEAPPVDPEDPILIPEDLPEFAEAVDPLPETEVPDLEDTGIPLPLSPILAYQELPTFVIEEKEKGEPIEETQQEELQVEEETDNLEEMDKNKITEQLLNNIENMVDPGATLEEQLSQMRVQLAALAQLPNVIQQTLALVTKQITQISQQKTVAVERMQTVQQVEEVQEQFMDAVTNIEESEVNRREETDAKNEEVYEEEERVKEVPMSDEEVAQIKREEQQRMIEEQQKLEKQKKELIEQMRIEQESRQVKQRSTPRVGKPRQIFGPPVPPERPVVLPGGRKWRKPEDAYNEQLIQETLTAQAEVIKGKAIGVNFMKYEKPPVSLDHLQRSEVYKAIHNMDEKPLKRVEMLTPVIAEADYRERKIKSRFSPINSVANRWPSRACSPNPQGEINDTMQ